MRSAALLALLALAGCGAPAPPANNQAGPAGGPAKPGATDLADPAVALTRLAREPEGPGRRPMLQAIRRAPPELAFPALRAGLADPDSAMRAAAAIAIGRRNDGRTLAPELITLATADSVTAVRVAAMRGLASLRHPEAFAALQPHLSDKTADIRLAALRALARIDSGRASELPELGHLQLDPDPRIAGAATKVSRRVPLN